MNFFLFGNEKSNVRLLPRRYLLFQDTYTEAQEFQNVFLCLLPTTSKQKYNPSGLLAETVLELHSRRMRKEINAEHFEDKLTHYTLPVCELNLRLLIYFLCSIYSDRQLMLSSLSSTTLLKSDWPCHSVQVREQPWES